MPPSGRAPLTSAQYKRKYGLALPKPKKQSGGNGITGFLRHAASVVKDYGEDQASRARTTGKFAYKYGQKVPVVALGKHIAQGKWDKVATQALEETGINSVRRIRSGKGGVGDYATVGLMAIPPARMSIQAGRAAARQPAFGVLSPGMVNRGLKTGEIMLDIPKPMEKLTAPKLFDRLFEGTAKNVAGTKSRPARFSKLSKKEHKYPPTGDEGYAKRIPMLVHKETGEVIHGSAGDVHGDLLSTLAARKLKQRGLNAIDNRNEYWHEVGQLAKQYNQAFVHHPFKGKLRIEMGHGTDVGIAPPKDDRGLRRAVNWITREFDDSNVTNMDLQEPPLWPPRSAGKSVPTHMTDDEIKEKAFEQFLLDEKRFTHQGARWRDEMELPADYNPKTLDWSKVKSGKDWEEMQRTGDYPLRSQRDYVFGQRIGPHKGGPFANARGAEPGGRARAEADAWQLLDPEGHSFKNLLAGLPKRNPADDPNGMGIIPEGEYRNPGQYDIRGHRGPARQRDPEADPYALKDVPWEVMGKVDADKINRMLDPAGSPFQRLVKGLAEHTKDIERAKKWWGRKIGGAYPDEETLMKAYYSMMKEAQDKLAKRYAGKGIPAKEPPLPFGKSQPKATPEVKANVGKAMQNLTTPVGGKASAKRINRLITGTATRDDITFIKNTIPKLKNPDFVRKAMDGKVPGLPPKLNKETKESYIIRIKAFDRFGVQNFHDSRQFRQRER